MRWAWVLLDGMEENGRPIQDGDPESLRAQLDGVALSQYADDWSREHVRQWIDCQLYDRLELFPYLLPSRDA